MLPVNSDPLLCLRQAIKDKATITYAKGDIPCSPLLNATHIVLTPKLSLPKSTPTRLTKPGITAATGPQDFYTLEAVYLAWLLRDAPGAEYMKQARENGLVVGFVSVTERKNVVDWLEAKTSDYERIAPLSGKSSRLAIVYVSLWLHAEESTTPPGTPPRTNLALLSSPSKSQPVSASPPKRRYVADSQDVEVVKRIKQNEVELRDRNTVLRGVKSNVGWVVWFYSSQMLPCGVELLCSTGCVC